jgi:hypothetical protein
VPVRARADGWTAERQTGFIEALARTGTVEGAARAVGMGTSSAYELRARPDAVAFREAWRVAIDYAVHQLGEAVIERALHGTATPVFYRGEQVGERRRYDERLAMFVLRLRDPQRFGSWREGRPPLAHPDAPAMLLGTALTRLGNAAMAQENGVEPVPRPPLPETRLLTRLEEEALVVGRAEHAAEERERAEERRRCEEVERMDAEEFARLDAEDRAAGRAAAGHPEPDEEEGA